MSKEIPELFLSSPKPQNAKHVYTVSEITQDIKLILENTFSEVWIEGEVSNFKGASSSGHYYFCLKDESAILQSVIFSRTAREIKFKLEDGLKVICSGKIEVYAPHGKYQLIIENIEPKGIGSLQLALEQLKKKLEKEGLFSVERKRKLPFLPAKIGIVTSSQGAAIEDILKVLEKRFKDIHVIISPVRVQGEGAKEEIAQAIADFNSFNERLPVNEWIEVMIVGRGGGSIEDLWAFNEEIVARAMYNSKIPVISAVGHERDVTIADLVADVRAATPSVAAEMVIPKKEDLRERLDDFVASLNRALSDIVITFKDSMDGLLHRLNLNMEHNLELNIGEFNAMVKKLISVNPIVKVKQYKIDTFDLARQIYVRMQHFIKLRESEFLRQVEKLSTLSPLNILGRGYSITFKLPEGEIIKDAKVVKMGDVIKTKLHKGEVLSEVKQTNSTSYLPAGRQGWMKI